MTTIESIIQIILEVAKILFKRKKSHTNNPKPLPDLRNLPLPPVERIGSNDYRNRRPPDHKRPPVTPSGVMGVVLLVVGTVSWVVRWW